MEPDITPHSTSTENIQSLSERYPFLLVAVYVYAFFNTLCILYAGVHYTSAQCSKVVDILFTDDRPAALFLSYRHSHLETSSFFPSPEISGMPG